MQHDEVIWQVIRHNHCSFMSKIETGKFCRNPYNVTGICNRSSCPLANSRYATIREREGVFYLYMKSIERAHMPKKLWERVKLPKNYLHAMKIIDKHMMFWPKFLVHKIKQRLTKMTQIRIRMRELSLKTREKVMPVPGHKNRREARRLEKAEKAALIEKRIENELIERLKDNIKNGIPLTGGVYNIDPKLWDNICKDESEDEAEEEVEYVEGYEDLEEEDDIEDFGNLAMTSFDDDQDELEDDDEASRTNFNSASTSKKKSQVTVEVEHEDGDRQMHLRT